MPTPEGFETIDERLIRLREYLATAQETIERAMTNGQSNEINGTTVTEIAFSAAKRREAQLSKEILELERRKLGLKPRGSFATTKTVT